MRLNGGNPLYEVWCPRAPVSPCIHPGTAGPHCYQPTCCTVNNTLCTLHGTVWEYMWHKCRILHMDGQGLDPILAKCILLNGLIHIIKQYSNISKLPLLYEEKDSACITIYKFSTIWYGLNYIDISCHQLLTFMHGHRHLHTRIKSKKVL